MERAIFEIPSGEFLAIKVVKIMAIASEAIVNINASPDFYLEKKDQISGLLSEVYHLCTTEGIECSNNSLELVWVMDEAKSQTYKANVNIYIVSRSISMDDRKAEQTAERMLSVCKDVLAYQKYNTVDIEYETYEKDYRAINKEQMVALIKRTKVEYLQNGMLPCCASYERIVQANQDDSQLVSTAIENQRCAISLQLIPQRLNGEEHEVVSRYSQILSTLAKGVESVGIGNVSIAAADKLAATYNYYNENRLSALFTYNYYVIGSRSAVQSLTMSVLGILNSQKVGQVSIEKIDIDLARFSPDNNIPSQPWILNNVIENIERANPIWNVKEIPVSLFRLPRIITSQEASELFRLPLGNNAINAGFTVNESKQTSKTYASGIIDSGDITVGMLKNSNLGNTIGLSLKDLTRHMLVVGAPGSGKTTFSVGLLDRLWALEKNQIPFLVIEPAKNEYRALIQSIKDIQIFTPGKNNISPFAFNPFVPPKKVRLETYKSVLKTAFEAGVSMSSPLDKIFEDSVNNCYSDYMWLDNYTVEDKGKIFNISDFIKCFQETFEAIGYTGDARNIGRAGTVRLKSLANLFDNYFSVGIDEMLKKPTIIELAAIENSDEKALIIALLLLSILSYVNSNYVGDGELKNVIVLEEAHVLLDAETNAGQGDANPAAVAQRLIKRMLAEIRSYGVGLVIADQSPRKVGRDVVGLTDIKVAFRLVEAEDKQIIADSSNMDENQVKRLSSLKPGESFLFFNKLSEPEEIKMDDYRLKKKIDITLSDDEVKRLTTYWNDKQKNLRPYPECDYQKCCKEDCIYNTRLLGREIARRICNKYLGPKATKERLKAVLEKETFLKLITSQLNGEPISDRLVECVRVHVLRNVLYDSNINISKATIEKTLTNIGKGK